MVTREWFYRHGGKVHGPVSMTDLRAAIALGFVMPGDLVREHIHDEWKPAAIVRRLVAVNDADRWPATEHTASTVHLGKRLPIVSHP